MNKQLRTVVILLGAAILAFSCRTINFADETDENIIARGTEAWNGQSPETARFYWVNIKDAANQKKYVGYIDSYVNTAKETNALSAEPPQAEAAYLSAYRRLHTVYSGFPKTLKTPAAVSRKMSAMAAGRGRALLDTNNVSGAQTLLKSAEETYGATAEVSALLAEADVLLGATRTEAAANTQVERARANEDFDEKIAGYERAITAVANGEKAFGENTLKIGKENTPVFMTTATRLKNKRQAIQLEMERALRERQYSFKDRIGEEFARQPEGGTLGTMTLEQILAHQESIKANIDIAYAEMRAFSAKYPTVIDRAMLREVELQKQDLEARITQINTEIRTARDIASRGKTAIPIMIGLFNPVPGGTREDQKSRPARMRGSIRDANDYWWGMVSIPSGTMNDLVITMDDERPVRVFAENTRSGARAGQLPDLVNRGYKVGNSWPVLNAGNQLPSSMYFVEIQKGRKQDYSGEAVIYSSFISRMR